LIVLKYVNITFITPENKRMEVTNMLEYTGPSNYYYYNINLLREREREREKKCLWIGNDVKLYHIMIIS
jgi:hypothetical protein